MFHSIFLTTEDTSVTEKLSFSGEKKFKKKNSKKGKNKKRKNDSIKDVSPPKVSKKNQESDTGTGLFMFNLSTFHLYIWSTRSEDYFYSTVTSTRSKVYWLAIFHDQFRVIIPCIIWIDLYIWDRKVPLRLLKIKFFIFQDQEE